ncbi:MAG: HEAT repeat domain-containing protein [Planctomycetes bacterium]|nr:HEAT repeat domain-containing protein [Planctomycetota bacterium]MBL7042962.1 HEAT repeat domain-containing protein [Pirellulaceae bacterium]
MTRKPAAGKASKPKPTLIVEPDSFAGIPEAINALADAAKNGDDDKLLQATKWLMIEGDAAVDPLAQVLNDEQADLAPRIAVCRTLRELGSKAKPALIQALGSESKQLQLNAIKALGLVRPADRDTVQTLMDLLDSDDERLQLEAILALGNIGPPAKDMCGERLVGILNDAEENGTLRDAAKRALKNINPRRKFTD